MRRTQIYIEEEQGHRLTAAAADAGVTMSALIRQAIDAFLDEVDSDAARLERFRSAVAEAAGSAPDLPAGRDYVDEIRPDYRTRSRSLWGREN